MWTVIAVLGGWSGQQQSWFEIMQDHMWMFTTMQQSKLFVRLFASKGEKKRRIWRHVCWLYDSSLLFPLASLVLSLAVTTHFTKQDLDPLTGPDIYCDRHILGIIGAYLRLRLRTFHAERSSQEILSAISKNGQWVENQGYSQKSKKLFISIDVYNLKVVFWVKQVCMIELFTFSLSLIFST